MSLPLHRERWSSLRHRCNGTSVTHSYIELRWASSWWPPIGPRWSGFQRLHPSFEENPVSSHFGRSSCPRPTGFFFILSPGPEALSLAPERAEFLAMGLPQFVVSTLQRAFAPSTSAAYSYCWRVFQSWCNSTQVVLLSWPMTSSSSSRKCQRWASLPQLWGEQWQP